jgi:hypothetical protein
LNYYEEPDAKKQTPLNRGFPHFLLVEGKDDGWFYETVCQLAGVFDKIEIRSVGDNSGTAFQRVVKFLAAGAPHLQTIALARDAEDDPAGTWRSACDALERAGLARPTQPGMLSAEQNGRRTGVLIVPAIDVPGSIETICWSSLGEQAIVSCVEDFLICSWGTDPASTPTTKALTDKARIRALLAVGSSFPRPVEAGKPFSAVVKEGKLWDWGHPAFAPIINFVKAVARVP